MWHVSHWCRSPRMPQNYASFCINYRLSRWGSSPITCYPYIWATSPKIMRIVHTIVMRQQLIYGIWSSNAHSATYSASNERKRMWNILYIRLLRIMRPDVVKKMINDNISTFISGHNPPIINSLWMQSYYSKWIYESNPHILYNIKKSYKTIKIYERKGEYFTVALSREFMRALNWCAATTLDKRLLWLSSTLGELVVRGWSSNVNSHV